MNDQKMSAPSEEFQDPLENYDPPTFDDSVEQALAEKTVGAIQSRPFTIIAPNTPVRTAVETLSRLEIGCLLVAENERLVGIFTERDVLNKVADRYADVANRPVSEFMTHRPVFVYANESTAAALCVMSLSGYRHVPVLGLDEKIVGIISPQRVTAFLQKHLPVDAAELK